jgi:hypothetical protein
VANCVKEYAARGERRDRRATRRGRLVVDGSNGGNA